jgi:uncharacterized membrane protein
MNIYKVNYVFLYYVLQFIWFLKASILLICFMTNISEGFIVKHCNTKS